MEIWLARHGETEWSAAGRHTGASDPPLTAAGEEEARHIGRVLAGRAFAVVYASPLTRARRTAELAGFQDLLVDPLLAEFDYGEYEGRVLEEIRRARPGWDLWRDGCPGGEDVQAVGARADRFLSALPGAGDDVLIFGHGHMLRVLAARHLGLDAGEARHLALGTGTLSILGHERDWPAVHEWNVPAGLVATVGLAGHAGAEPPVQ
ncbi:MAG TPA: histidine phosphatase family protein [Candidatus Acidoferrum sp.]|nr:histidine phosphatase family protein [Candidatus Acidoferrum sp.]